MKSQHNPEVSLPNPDDEARALEARVSEALDRARRGGAEQAEVTASMQGGLNVTARLGAVETIEHTRDRGLSVTVYIKQAKGHASSADLSDDSLRDSVERALDIARFTASDSCNGLADPERMATSFPDLDLWHPAPLDADAAIERALRMEAAGREQTGNTNSEGASVSGSFGVSIYGNSHGFLGSSNGSRKGKSSVLIAGEGGGMHRDYCYDSRRAPEEL